jgi:hypothetical protein
MHVSAASWTPQHRPRWKRTLFVIIALGTLLIMIPLAILFAIAYGVACLLGWIGRTIGVRLGLARARGPRRSPAGWMPNPGTRFGASVATSFRQTPTPSPATASPPTQGDISPDLNSDLRKNVRVRLPRPDSGPLE